VQGLLPRRKMVSVKSLVCFSGKGLTFSASCKNCIHPEGTEIYFRSNFSKSSSGERELGGRSLCLCNTGIKKKRENQTRIEVKRMWR